MCRASSRSMRLGAVRLPGSSSATPLWSRSMRGNSCGISNGASLMSASFCCRCCIPTDVSANNRAGHKFNVDQVVDYVPKGASKFSVPRGAYKITKLLPERDGELQYRTNASLARANWLRFSYCKSVTGVGGRRLRLALSMALNAHLAWRWRRIIKLITRSARARSNDIIWS